MVGSSYWSSLQNYNRSFRVSLWLWRLCLNYLLCYVSYLAFAFLFPDYIFLISLDSWPGSHLKSNFLVKQKNHSRRIRWPSSYLDLNVSNFCCRANDGPPNKCGEDVLWEVGACVAALDKLKERQTRKPKHRGTDEEMHSSTDEINYAVQQDEVAVILGLI